MGQLWVLSGAFLGPILATAKILFSILCTFLNDWSSPLQDEELNLQYVQFLTALANGYNSLETWPRLIIPHGNSTVALHLHGDGSQFLASAVLYLITAKNESITDKSWNISDAQSINVDSVSKVKHHSVPICEALGMYEGSCLVSAFIADNHHHLASSFNFSLNIGSDSTCTLHLLRPGKSLKNVLLKNTTIKLKNMWSQISTTYNISINIYYINSDRNCADLNSKISLDPISLTNSQMWRNGIPEFLDPAFPEKDKIFLNITNGVFTIQLLTYPIISKLAASVLMMPTKSVSALLANLHNPSTTSLLPSSLNLTFGKMEPCSTRSQLSTISM